MSLRKMTLAAAAAALAVTPALAQVSFTPAIAPLNGDENDAASGVVFGIVAAAAIIGGLVVLSGGDEKEVPVSG